MRASEASARSLATSITRETTSAAESGACPGGSTRPASCARARVDDLMRSDSAERSLWLFWYLVRLKRRTLVKQLDSDSLNIKKITLETPSRQSQVPVRRSCGPSPVPQEPPWPLRRWRRRDLPAPSDGPGLGRGGGHAGEMIHPRNDPALANRGLVEIPAGQIPLETTRFSTTHDRSTGPAYQTLGLSNPPPLGLPAAASRSRRPGAAAVAPRHPEPPPPRSADRRYDAL